MSDRLTYTVKHGFNHTEKGVDTWYTRENADQIGELPRAVRDDLIATGMIEEHKERGSAPTPPAAATPGREK
jgi:hypothetical protein